jgi:predicted amidophosphoribosyltransferase
LKGILFPERLIWVDATSRRDHRFLRLTDHCLYFGEFHAGGGWTAGATNDLIIDFKRSPSDIAASLRSQAVRRFKERAIKRVAQALRRQFGSAAVETQLTFVPIPPSKLPGELDHCDRLLRTLQLAFAGLDADVRPLLRQRANTAPDHRSGGCRMRFGELLEITELDAEQLKRPLRPLVVLFDDVLTSGKHLAVAKLRIREALPEQAIIAVLVARRVRPAA